VDQERRAPLTPEERLEEIERSLKENPPAATFVDKIEAEEWKLPHDPEQWVRVRKLTPLEIRQYQAVATKASSPLGGDEWHLEMRPAEGYLYLLTHSIVAFRLKDVDGWKEGEQKRGRDGITIVNEKELREVFSRLEGRIAAWLEQRLLIYNDLVR